MTEVTRVVGRLVVAVLVTAAAGLAVPGPAAAAACGGPHGVTVVVDHHQLGGGVTVRCDGHGGGRDAATRFHDAGFDLTYAQRQPGFVCRVDGVPASDPCVNTSPADAYWSLWWSDGKSGRWSYSSLGTGSLTVPDGGYVALSWQGGDTKAEPGVAPAAHPTAAPTPTSSPTHPASPTATPSTSAPTPAAPTTTPTPTPTKASTSAAARHHTAHPSPTARHHTRHTHPAEPGPSTHDRSSAPVDRQASASGSSGSGLPGWVAPVLVLLLFLAAGSVAVVRRRRPGGG